ncbi:2-C-methyl-D-erythritol 4-phosphate cytidylyltransferase [Cecembia calidifontis]|jgi:2-C-methyl-D-erythritol 4-phosphate cytidylyltransferase|uniref:2-C-methyl-D-erythritol 4-phosphate cytidylyltransferase n=1 Tax=Cecembia calidifontis TaxID=1187080 RepID=A0A4Q7P8G4_9BACT|nr:2-C-methyl-D-erythritol 4-phosphate cytidylyltransferase [Cecembia calidifontis]RZS96385.1 2-C-methyl-D-erythritol 4-phosphate cytidylyltransferase [Cecembia calidifontis]
MKKYALIVAGGSGTRMGSPIAKQYLPIGGKPVLMHTLEKFQDADPEIELTLVLPEADFPFWKKLCEEHAFSVPHHLVPGGRSRFQSVKNGLESLKLNQGTVAIHDGVRPFVSREVILQSFREAEAKGSAIAVIPLKDSIRKLTDDGRSIFQERQYFRLVQTPQTFDLSKIKQAFKVQELGHFTDDATVFEHQGWQVHLIAGNPENIKITTPEDMEFADFLIGKKRG